MGEPHAVIERLTDLLPLVDDWRRQPPLGSGEGELGAAFDRKAGSGQGAGAQDRYRRYHQQGHGQTEPGNRERGGVGRGPDPHEALVAGDEDGGRGSQPRGGAQ